MDNQSQLIVEQAKSLDNLKKQPGWFILTDMLERFEKDRFDDLVGYRGSDREVLRSLQISARTIKELRVAIDQRIQDAIDAGKQVLTDYAIEEEIL